MNNCLWDRLADLDGVWLEKKKSNVSFSGREVVEEGRVTMVAGDRPRLRAVPPFPGVMAVMVVVDRGTGQSSLTIMSYWTLQEGSPPHAPTPTRQAHPHPRHNPAYYNIVCISQTSGKTWFYHDTISTTSLDHKSNISKGVYYRYIIIYLPIYLWIFCLSASRNMRDVICILSMTTPKIWSFL